jgi:hypothetical protein
MKDLIDHMTVCHEQLQWAGDSSTQSFLTESLLVDLGECRQLCQDLKSNTATRRAGSSHAMAVMA